MSTAEECALEVSRLIAVRGLLGTDLANAWGAFLEANAGLGEPPPLEAALEALIDRAIANGTTRAELVDRICDGKHWEDARGERAEVIMMTGDGGEYPAHAVVIVMGCGSAEAVEPLCEMLAATISLLPGVRRNGGRGVGKTKAREGLKGCEHSTLVGFEYDACRCLTCGETLTRASNPRYEPCPKGHDACACGCGFCATCNESFPIPETDPAPPAG